MVNCKGFGCKPAPKKSIEPIAWSQSGKNAVNLLQETSWLRAFLEPKLRLNGDTQSAVGGSASQLACNAHMQRTNLMLGNFEQKGSVFLSCSVRLLQLQLGYSQFYCILGVQFGLFQNTLAKL